MTAATTRAVGTDQKATAAGAGAGAGDGSSPPSSVRYDLGARAINPNAAIRDPTWFRRFHALVPLRGPFPQVYLLFCHDAALQRRKSQPTYMLNRTRADIPGFVAGELFK